MARVPTTKAALLASGAACIASVSSRPDDPAEWDRTTAFTQLSVWWEEDEARPFLAVVEGLLGPAAAPHMVERFKAMPKGTLDAALNWFEPSNLRDELAEAIPDYAEERFPDASTIRAARAAEGRFYSGEADMRAVALWLYDEEADAQPTALARRIERDFGVPFRTAFNTLTGGNLSGWAAAFISAMRFFDRKAFDRAAQHGEADDDLE